MFTKLIKISGLALSLLVTSQAFSQSTQDVWQHHIKAFEDRDLDGITADYTNDSVLILNGKTFQGIGSIKKAFSQLFRIFDQGNNKIDPTVISGRIVYITWHFTLNGQDEFFGSDSFVIEHGKIAVQTIASPLYDAMPVTP